MTFSPSRENSPVWSPDGRRIAYASDRKGLFHIYQKAADGTGEEETLLETNAEERPMSWSSDGRYLAYQRHDPQGKTKLDVWILPLFGDRRPFALVQSEFDETYPEFSPNGRWLAYTSNESGRDEVYVMPFPQAGGKWLISGSGGSQPKWRRDGKVLYYLGGDYKLIAVSIQEKGAALEVGQSRPLFQARPVSAFGNLFDVSADGKRFLIPTSTEPGNAEPITLVVNWTAELKK